MSTQQILHPALYLRGVVPAKVTLPDISKILPSGWNKLEENVLGEFAVRSVLKQFLGPELERRVCRLPGRATVMLSTSSSREAARCW